MKGLNRKVIMVLIVLCLLGIAALLSGCSSRVDVEDVEFESSNLNIRVDVVDGKKYIWVYGGGITLHHDEVRDD